MKLHDVQGVFMPTLLRRRSVVHQITGQCAQHSGASRLEEHAGKAAHRARSHRRLTLGVEISQNASHTKGNAMMLCART